MLAEIFMLQLESAYRASDDMIQSKKFHFVPLPEIVLPISEAADRIDDTYKSLWHTMHDDVYTYAVSAAIAFGIALSVWLCGVWLIARRGLFAAALTAAVYWLEILSGRPAASRDYLVFNRQTLDQLQSRPFNSGDMHEHIRAARIRDQEPIAFCKIEPLHGALHDLGAPIHSGVPLITRKGNDLTRRFPFIAMAVAALPVPSCLIDGEAIVSDDDGRAVFDRIRGHGTLAGATLCAFDLLQVDGRDLRREPLEARRRALAKLLRRSHSSLVVNEHFEGDGAIVFREACRLGCEGIVSKRLGSPYRSGRTISSAIVVGDRRTTANGELGRQLGTIARDKGRQAARFVGSNRKGIRWT